MGVTSLKRLPFSLRKKPNTQRAQVKYGFIQGQRKTYPVTVLGSRRLADRLRKQGVAVGRFKNGADHTGTKIKGSLPQTR